MFYIRENYNDWAATSATTLASAKRAASRAQMFCGSDVFVGVKSGDAIIVIAQKLHRDALDMNAVGEWQEA